MMPLHSCPAWLRILRPGVGEINSIIPFSVSTEGLDLSRTLFIGKSAGKVFGMQGAMGALVENVINIDAGVLDGLAASFIPGLTVSLAW